MQIVGNDTIKVFSSGVSIYLALILFWKLMYKFRIQRFHAGKTRNLIHDGTL
jgi:hypothetical protein